MFGKFGCFFATKLYNVVYKQQQQKDGKINIHLPVKNAPTAPLICLGSL